MADITGINLGGDTNIANVLQRKYDPTLYQLNRLDVGISKKFNKLKNFQTIGAGFYFGTVMRDDEKGVSSETEDATITTPERPTYIQGYVVDFYMYATIRLTAQAAARAKRGGGWVSDFIADQIKRKREQLYRYDNEQCCRNGDGVCTQANGAGSSSTSMTVDSTRHLHVGMYIEVYTAAGVAEIASVKITNINRKTKVLTLASASDWSDNSNVYRDGQYNSGTPLEHAGLRQMISEDTSTTFQNINRGTYLEYIAYHDSDGGAPSRDKLFQAINHAELWGSKGVIDDIWMNRQTRNKYFQIIMPAIQYQGPKDLELAYNPQDNPITFEAKTFAVDECIFDGDTFGINWDTMGRITSKEIGTDSAIPQLNNTLLRDAGKDAVSLFLSWFTNPVCMDPRSNFRISGTDTLYTY
uniref:Putative capsid protein n=1 Tax=viral metagenome TaxID=1070528 RepID=A0A6H1ZIH9_9ZZZZ